MMPKCTSFDDLENATVKGNVYRINFQFMVKNETVDRMKKC